MTQATELESQSVPALGHGLVVVLFCVFALVAKSDTIVLNPVADTTLLESAPDFNMGGEGHLAAGTTGSMAQSTRNRALLRFDLSGIPPQSQILSAILTLQVTGVPGRDGGDGPINSSFILHRVLRSWGEGAKLGFRGEFATAGEATWNHAISAGLGAPGGTPWSVPGAGGPSDAASEASASQFVSGLGAYEFGPSTPMRADLQRWVENPSLNFGWLLMSDSESRKKTARRFGSREDPKATPRLTIEYVVPDLPRIDRVMRRDDRVEMWFVAEAETAYLVQFRNRLAVGNWLVLTNISRGPVRRDVVVMDSISGVERVYRLGRF